MRMSSRISVVCLAIAVFSGHLAAQDGLITDRPDFTESTEAIVPGRWQIETGASWTDSEAEDGINLPEALVRTGFAERWELRLGLPEYVDVGDISGVSDGSLGVKFEVGALGPGSLALIGEVSIPIGDDDLTSDSVDPTAIVIYGQDLPDGWSLGSQIGVSSISVGDDDLTVVAPTLVFGTEFRPRWGTFFELAAEIPDQGGSAVVFHTGVTWAAAPSRQWDAHVAIGLSDAAPDVQVGVGYSVGF